MTSQGVFGVLLMAYHTRRYGVEILPENVARSSGLMSRRSYIFNVPPRIRKQLEHRLRRNGFAGHQALAQWLNEQGYKASKCSVGRYSRNFARRLKAIELAAAQAQAIAEVAVDHQATMTGALIGLVQQKLFTALVEAEQLDLRNLPQLSRAIGDLCRTAIAQKRETDEARLRLEEQKGTAVKGVDKIARASGLSPDAHRQVRELLLGIDPFPADIPEKAPTAPEQPDAQRDPG